MQINARNDSETTPLAAKPPAARAEATIEPDLLRIVVDTKGDVVAAGAHTQQLLAGAPGAYRLIPGIPGFWVLVREDSHAATASVDSVLMAGAVVSNTTVMDVASMISGQKWFGDFHVFSDTAHRVLTFDRGYLTAIRSNRREDRLDQIVLAMGLVTPSQVKHLLQQADTIGSFAQLLMDQGLMTRAQLSRCLDTQARRVFLASLTLGRGRYMFSASSGPATPVVHLAIERLLLEGAERIDELTVFRQRLPHDDLRPILVRKPSRRLESPNVRLVASHCDGKSTIRDIVRRIGAPDFECLKIIHDLLLDDCVALHAPPGLDEEAVRRMVTHFNQVMYFIYAAVERHGHIEETRRTLAEWIDGSGYGAYLGQAAAVDGAVGAETVLEALRTNELEQPLGSLQQALHDLAAFARLVATTQLPAAEDAVLAAQVDAVWSQGNAPSPAQIDS